MSKPKPTPGKQSKPVTRTLTDKLRGIVNLKADDKNLYTQRELSEMLGISVRTIRRFKNQKGYELAAKTKSRISQSVTREDKKIKRLVDSGTVLKVIVTRSKGKTKRAIVQTKGVKQPRSKILQLPVLYTAKSGESQTLKISVVGWSTDEKIAYIENAHAEHRFLSWHARVKVPVGVSKSGRVGEGELVGDEEDYDEETGEALTPQPVFYMIGPFDLKKNRAKIRSEINYHEDAGRVIVEIYLVESVKGKK